MDEQFVDFYQILELPLDADRNTLRKRINALYLDAQSNLDHRDFETRLKSQKLFESTLPQARFVLLDDTRRAQYLALVRDFRAPGRDNADPTPRTAPRFAPRPAPPDSPPRLTRTGQNPPDDRFYDPQGAQIEPLPTARPAAEQLQAQREELWKKWKIGLEEALAQHNSTSQSASTDPISTRRDAPAISTRPASPALQETLQRQSESQQQRELDAADTPSEKEIEARRAAQRREITRETLVNVNLIWSSVGALLVVVPGVVALVELVDHFYPRGAAARLPLPANALWLAGFTVIAVGAFFAARELSEVMRRRATSKLAALSYEELLRRNQNGSR
ncbi:MAG TPA: hypothetical protein VF627_10080 [Abditibacterium sp.]